MRCGYIVEMVQVGMDGGALLDRSQEVGTGTIARVEPVFRHLGTWALGRCVAFQGRSSGGRGCTTTTVWGR